VKRQKLKLPEIKLGSWTGEIVGSCSVSFGHHVQPGAPQQCVEFTWMIMPAMLTMPEPRFTWPGVIMIFVPTPLKTDFADAGHLIRGQGLLSFALTLEVTRAQFSDMLGMMKRKRLKEFHFTIGEAVEDGWPVSSWGMSAMLD
jgi:hypothetical protein